MSETLTVPAEIVGHVRTGLHSVLGDSADEISQVTDLEDREEHPELYVEGREHYDLPPSPVRHRIKNTPSFLLPEVLLAFMAHVL